MSESNKVAKYDRALLEASEVQPIKEVEGYMITVNRYGWFFANLGEVEVKGTTLDEVEEKIKKTLTAIERKKRKKLGKARPCFIYCDSRDAEYCGHGFFTGVHAGNGDYMWRSPSGETFRAHGAVFFSPTHESVETLAALVAERDGLRDRLRDLQSEILKIVNPQAKAMVGKINTGFGRTPYVRNNAELANLYTAEILSNVLGVEVPNED